MSTKKSVEISESGVLIRINQTFSPGISSAELYDVTRGVWVIGDRREKAQYAFAIAGGIIREVYEIHSWHPAGTTTYKTRTQNDVDIEGRWEFVGAIAPPSIREKYVDCSVADYFQKGAANPIIYVNIR